MNKKAAIIALIVIVCILIIVFLIVRNNRSITPSGGNVDNTVLTDEERVLEESKTIELEEPNFMQRSGFELVKSDELIGVNYDKVYSQEAGKAQVNLDYNGKKISLFISKTKLYENTSDEEPIVHFVGDTEVSYVVGDDGIKNYYYQKDNMFYSLSTNEDLNNGELESLVNGFDTKIGENY